MDGVSRVCRLSASSSIAGITLRCREPPQWAMYGRRPHCKRNLTFLRSVRVQPCIRPVFAWRIASDRDAAAVAAGPDVIR